ncbi:MAG: monovalent cation/H+ antiporter complex subunit F [Candidatus Bipolaricaulia bacterium]
MSAFYSAFFAILGACCFLCLYRVAFGPTPPDRAVGIDILGIVIVGLSALFSLVTGKDYYTNIALAWALIAFIGTIALAKFLEGRSYDE